MVRGFCFAGQPDPCGPITPSAAEFDGNKPDAPARRSSPRSSGPIPIPIFTSDVTDDKDGNVVNWGTAKAEAPAPSPAAVSKRAATSSSATKLWSTGLSPAKDGSHPGRRPRRVTTLPGTAAESTAGLKAMGGPQGK